MFTLSGRYKIHLYQLPVDGRWGFDRLADLIKALGVNPYSGDLALFFNKSKTRSRMIFYDMSTCYILNGRLEVGTFKILWSSTEPRVELRMSDLLTLLGGFELPKRQISGRRWNPDGVEVYRIEGQAKEDRLTPDERLTLRQARSAAIMNKLRVLIESLNPPPRSSLGKAKNYAIKRWKELTVFLRDGRVEIDNNAVEREFKLAKLGFKNFMFCQSEVGCDAVATFYTLIATCKIHNVSIEPYLADVLLKLEAGWPQSRIDELLPWNWQPSTLKPSRRQMSDGTYEEDILAELVIERRNLDGNVYLKSQRGPPAEPIQSDSPTR